MKKEITIKKTLKSVIIEAILNAIVTCLIIYYLFASDLLKYLIEAIEVGGPFNIMLIISPCIIIFSVIISLGKFITYNTPTDTPKKITKKTNKKSKK